MRRDAKRKQVNADLLKQVADAFARFRSGRRSPRARFPDEIRRLALAAVEAGHASSEVAQAAAVDRSDLGRWRREAQVAVVQEAPPKARELRIVKRREDSIPLQAVASDDVVVLRIGRHVAIDLPLTALTPNFLRMLVVNEGGAP